jgi:hypothetical protein
MGREVRRGQFTFLHGASPLHLRSTGGCHAVASCERLIELGCNVTSECNIHEVTFENHVTYPLRDQCCVHPFGTVVLKYCP